MGCFVRIQPLSSKDLLERQGMLSHQRNNRILQVVLMIVIAYLQCAKHNKNFRDISSFDMLSSLRREAIQSPLLVSERAGLESQTIGS